MKAMVGCLALVAVSIIGMATQAAAQVTDVAPTLSQGTARTIDPGLLNCDVRGSRTSALGEMTADDGTGWVVPADVAYADGPIASDMYNECTGVVARAASDIDLDSVPVFEVDPGGETITAYLFADNYFELYVNGQRVAVDPVPFTPFNSNVVRFSVHRPFTAALLLVDWEEVLGLGLESGRGGLHPGDGGLVAVFADREGDLIATTNDSWTAQTFYTAPLHDPTCLVLSGAARLSDQCDQSDVTSAEGLLAAHWPLPDGWQEAGFDDSAWPAATVFSNQTVGVDNKPAYTNFPDIFDNAANDAQFIWSSNLVLDNLVVVRQTID